MMRAKLSAVQCPLYVAAPLTVPVVCMVKVVFTVAMVRTQARGPTQGMPCLSLRYCVLRTA